MFLANPDFKFMDHATVVGLVSTAHPCLRLDFVVD